MTGKVAPTQPGVTVGNGQLLTPSLANFFKISVVLDRLYDHLNSRNQINSAELFCLCLSLARGIDRAVGHNESLDRFVKLKPLLTQISKFNRDPYLHAAVTVLMISVKHACINGWFPDHSEQFVKLANELEMSFSSEVYASGTGDSLTTINTVMSRFYPSMKMGKILSSFEVKPGYGTYLEDFNILKSDDHPVEDKIYLLVVQTDKIETSACIITPQKANFLVNGKGVQKRVNVSMDNGPQLPTDVTGMLQFGCNLIQAIGQFDGHYIIILAFMSLQSIPETPLLEDFDQSAVLTVESDSDVIEGPTRIVLNCPISCSRIRTPVKGKSCKHLQCFDFRNFIDINSRRPSWRCPLCNQSCSYTDIRFDQNILKILQEVGDNENGVVISANGSWNAVVRSNNDLKELESDLNKNFVELQELSATSKSPHVLDLTDGEEDMDLEDKKPMMYSDTRQDTSTCVPLPSGWNHANDNITQQAPNHSGHEYLRSALQRSESLPSCEQLVSNVYANVTSAQNCGQLRTSPVQSVVMPSTGSLASSPWIPSSPVNSVRCQASQDTALPVLDGTQRQQVLNSNPIQLQCRGYIPDQTLNQPDLHFGASSMSYGVPPREPYLVAQSRIHLSVTAQGQSSERASYSRSPYRQVTQASSTVSQILNLQGVGQAVAGAPPRYSNGPPHQVFTESYSRSHPSTPYSSPHAPPARIQPSSAIPWSTPPLSRVQTHQGYASRTPLTPMQAVGVPIRNGPPPRQSVQVPMPRTHPLVPTGPHNQTLQGSEPKTSPSLSGFTISPSHGQNSRNHPLSTPTRQVTGQTVAANLTRPPMSQLSHFVSTQTPNARPPNPMNTVRHWEPIRVGDTGGASAGSGAIRGSHSRPAVGDVIMMNDESLGIPTISPDRTPAPHLQAFVNRGVQFTQQRNISNQHIR